MALELPGITDRILACWARVQAMRPGLSQAKFAAEHGLRQQSFNEWIKNGVQPSLDGLKALAEAFGVSWQWLLLGDDAPMGRGADQIDADIQLIINTIIEFQPQARKLDPGHRREIIEHLVRQIPLLVRERREAGVHTPAPASAKRAAGSEPRAGSPAQPSRPSRRAR